MRGNLASSSNQLAQRGTRLSRIGELSTSLLEGSIERRRQALLQNLDDILKYYLPTTKVMSLRRLTAAPSWDQCIVELQGIILRNTDLLAPNARPHLLELSGVAERLETLFSALWHYNEQKHPNNYSSRKDQLTQLAGNLGIRINSQELPREETSRAEELLPVSPYQGAESKTGGSPSFYSIDLESRTTLSPTHRSPLHRDDTTDSNQSPQHARALAREGNICSRFATVIYDCFNHCCHRQAEQTPNEAYQQM